MRYYLIMIENIKYCHSFNNENRSFHFDHVHIKWDEQINLHTQDFWELTYIITGRGTRVIGNIMEPFAEGEVIMIPPHIPHCWSFDKRVCDAEGKIENICIFFSDEFLKNSKAVFPELAEMIQRIQNITNAVAFGEETLIRIQNHMKSMVEQTKEEKLSSLIKILSFASSPTITNVVGQPALKDKKEKKMQVLQLYVMNNFQKNITLDEVTRFIGMEKSSFCVFFKKMSGQSFFSYLNTYRIESSCKLLLNTSLSVAEVCYACGFEDVPYYNRTFKKLKGITPTEFRNHKL